MEIKTGDEENDDGQTHWSHSKCTPKVEARRNKNNDIGIKNPFKKLMNSENMPAHSKISYVNWFFNCCLL